MPKTKLNRPLLRGCIPMLAATLLGLAACATPAERTARLEDDLAAAGFVARPADTAERRALLASLPPNRLLRRDRGELVTYVYADPLVCGCLYVGSQDAYGRYRRQAQRQRLADEREATAELYADASWNWGPWGPFDGRFGW